MFNFSNITPVVRNLLLINLAVFLVQENVRDLPITQFGSLYPLGSPYFHVWQLLTHMFMHGSWLHIFSNMFGLISFGPLLEQRWGSQRFLAFWLLCGIGAGGIYEGVRAYELHQIEVAYQDMRANPGAGEFGLFMKQVGYDKEDYEAAASALQRNPGDQALRQEAINAVEEMHNRILNSPGGGMLGASGALFGVLFAFAYLFPNTTLMLLFPPIPIKAKYFVFLYGAYELYSGVYKVPGDTVAHFAHIGGLIIGFIILQFWERNRQQFY